MTPPTKTGSSTANGVARPDGSDRHLDVEQRGGAFLGRELVGDRPPRRLGIGTQLGLQTQMIDLDHHTVELVVEVVAHGLELGDAALDVIDRRNDFVCSLIGNPSEPSHSSVSVWEASSGPPSTTPSW